MSRYTAYQYHLSDIRTALAGPNFGSEICFFLAFYEAKMTKIDIPNPKLNDPNDYQLFYIQILCCFELSLTLNLVFQLLMERSQKSSLL